MSLKRTGEALAADAKRAKQDGSITAFFGAPKSTASSSSAVARDAKGASFNKQAWVASLTEEQKGLLRLEINTLHESWLAHLKDELVTKEFLDLKRFLKREVESGAKIFPPSEDVYSWSRHTPLNKVKVVILGQDPYHGPNQAHGLCFSVRPPTPAPPSLKNMYKALAIDYPDKFKPPPNGMGLLTPWADQGVLLLNSVLTVRAHNANSHQGKGWERLTQRAIDAVVKTQGSKKGVVFLAWGSYAQKRMTGIRPPSLVLKSVHPSPLSAHNGFFTCGHFKKANEFLRREYGPAGEIDWNLGPAVKKAIDVSVEKNVDVEKVGEEEVAQVKAVEEVATKVDQAEEKKEAKDGKDTTTGSEKPKDD